MDQDDGAVTFQPLTATHGAALARASHLLMLSMSPTSWPLPPTTAVMRRHGLTEHAWATEQDKGAWNVKNACMLSLGVLKDGCGKRGIVTARD